MKTVRFYTLAAALALGVVLSSQDVQASHDARYLSHHNRHQLSVNHVDTTESQADLALFDTLHKELLSAQTESEIDHVVSRLILYRLNHPQSLNFQLLLNEVNENVAYFSTRVHDRFDYGAIKKGLGLGIATGLIAYGIKSIQTKCYEKHEALKQLARAELQAEGIVVPENHYFGYEYEGFNPNDIALQNKINDFRTHQCKANASRVGQCALGGVGVVTGLNGVAQLYKGLSTDCAQEFARYSLLKAKLEHANATYYAQVNNN